MTADLQTVSDFNFQMGTSSWGHDGRRIPTWAFIKHGAIMAATVHNSPQTVQMNMIVEAAFIKMCKTLSDDRELARKLASLGKKLKDRLDVHESVIVAIMQRVMDILDPLALPEPPKKQIGFHVRERKAVYRVKWRRSTA